MSLAWKVSWEQSLKASNSLSSAKLNDILLKVANGLPILGTPLRDMRVVLYAAGYFMNEFEIVARKLY